VWISIEKLVLHLFVLCCLIWSSFLHLDLRNFSCQCASQFSSLGISLFVVVELRQVFFVSAHKVKVRSFIFNPHFNGGFSAAVRTIFQQSQGFCSIC
jgi:hypothetical protein